MRRGLAPTVWLLLVTRPFGFQGFSMSTKFKDPFHVSRAKTDYHNLNDETPYGESSSRRILLKLPFAVALNPAWHFVEPGNGLSAEDAATAYDSYASTYDDLNGGQAATILGIDGARADLLQRARGNVLEIGVGTGLNFDKYDATKVTAFTFVDISDGMLKEALRRHAAFKDLQGIPANFVNADATCDLVKLFGERRFDTVVDTFSLCVFGNDGAKRTLHEIRQVVKDKADGGYVLLLENSRSSNRLLGLYQDVTAEQAASMGGKGCVYNQDVDRLIRGSGMVISQEKRYAAGLFRSFSCTAN